MRALKRVLLLLVGAGLMLASLMTVALINSINPRCGEGKVLSYQTEERGGVLYIQIVTQNAGVTMVCQTSYPKFRLSQLTLT